MAGNDMTSRVSYDKSQYSLNDPKFRGVLYQIAVVICLMAGAYWIASNTINNLQRAHIASGFGFLEGRAGFDISQTLISFSSDSTYGRALLVGFSIRCWWRSRASSRQRYSVFSSASAGCRAIG